VRVDRMEPSKNIVRGFRAFELLLERYPHLQGQVRFLAFLVPSRTNIRLYQRYTYEVRALVDAINRRFGTAEWTPIKLFYEENYPQAIAALTLYDVLLVNAVADGMNLVAKEGPTVNTRDGVLVLSETAGAHGQLGEHALTVAAADIEGTCNALYTALTMAPEERRRRAEALRRSIVDEDITLWLWWQVQDLKGKERRNRRKRTALTS
jgi:trehalose 6-phosphate synthase